MIYPKSCCSALVVVLGSKVLSPGSQGYNASLASYYSAQEAAVHPFCIVTPISTTDVSRAITTLTRSNCTFAIRSGGHSTWAGDANIASGVTIDLQGLNAVELSHDRSTVSVGQGNRWGEVYKALLPENRTVAGGRVAEVGVGGLTLGAGLSAFTPRFGFTCDSVVNFEVVLASGEVINANEGHNADLLHALRSGSNNFGVVTRIDFQTHEQGDIWGGVPLDEYASLTMSITYAAGGNHGVSNTLYYTKPVKYPKSFNPFTDIPSVSDTLRTANFSSFADEGTANNPEGYRALLATSSIGSSLQVLTASFEAWNKSVAAFSEVVGLEAKLFFEPVPQVAYQTTTLAPNVLGLDHNQGGLVIVGVAVGWTNRSDDALVTQVAQRIVAEIDEKVKDLGEYFDFVYLNYAMDWQNVIGSYGAENVAKLQNVSKTYDPNGVLQSNVPGGYKLF
ncbi:hypothetical protein MMC13_000930 [Lambiella insularis]|nr:hypothetical protein [Lambiella insularis]